MSKPLKDMMIKEIAARFAGVQDALVVNPIPLTANETNQFRGDMKSKNITVKVIRNSLAKRAFAGTSLECVGELLTGPSAMMTGGDSIVDVAREAMDWKKKLRNLEVIGAVVEGKVLDAEGVKMLSTMPTRVELQGQIVQLAQSPGAKIASAIGAPAANIAGCIKALIEKLEEPAEAA